MKRVGVSGVLLGVLTLAAAVALLLWPMHANGVDGSALMPRYHDFWWGFTTSDALPEQLTRADLARLGLRLPKDVVGHRRHLAYELIAGAVAIGASGAAVLLVLRRGRRAEGE